MKALTLLTLAMTIALSSYSQRSKGYIIYKNTDTCWGTIGYNFKEPNPDHIVFIPHWKYRRHSSLTPNDIRGFTVGNTTWRSAHVFEGKPVFLKVVKQGRFMSLYSRYLGNNRIQYFIDENNDEFIVLRKEVLRQQLRNAFFTLIDRYRISTGIPSEYIERAIYTKESLVEYVDIINDLYSNRSDKELMTTKMVR